MNISNRLSLRAITVENQKEIEIYAYTKTEVTAHFNVFQSHEDFINNKSILCYIQKPTGLIDRNKVELYEGDLVTDFYLPSTGLLMIRPIVKFSDGEFVLTSTDAECYYYPLKDIYQNKEIPLFQKIGTIYDNNAPRNFKIIADHWKTKY